MIRTYETKNQKWNPTREQVEEMTRKWLKNGGEIKNLDPEPLPISVQVYISSQAAEPHSALMAR